MAKTSVPSTGPRPGDPDKHSDRDQRKAIKERAEPTVSRPGGFKNDPDDPTNPNEAVERHRRRLRPRPLP